jgi:hypothetical protein
MFNSMSRYSIFLVVVTFISVLTGCGSPAKREAMIPQGAAASKSHPYSVIVQTNGGSETGALESGNISDMDLKAAIEDAISQKRVFTKIVQGSGADYELSVRVINLSKPVFGTTFTVDMEAAWTLTKTADNSIMMQKSIKSTGKATMGDAFVAATRIRLAVENAARENIDQGLKAIMGLSL